MNILIIGSGGREHAFAWKISQSTKISQLYISPGNAGTAEFGINIEVGGYRFCCDPFYCFGEKHRNGYCRT
jgi:phosphoribosylamine--glycine ligase